MKNSKEFTVMTTGRKYILITKPGRCETYDYYPQNVVNVLKNIGYVEVKRG